MSYSLPYGLKPLSPNFWQPSVNEDIEDDDEYEDEEEEEDD